LEKCDFFRFGIDTGTEMAGQTNPTRQRGLLAVAIAECLADPLADASG